MKTFVVIGLGRFGTAVAEELSALGHEVLALDGAEENVQKVADQVTHAVTGDARDPAVLRALGVRNYDCAIVAVGDDVGNSALITLNLKELGVKKVICKAVMEKLVIPNGLYGLIRLPEYKNLMKGETWYNRLGIENDAVFGKVPYGYGNADGGTGGLEDGTDQWLQLIKEAAYTPQDGEIYWNSWFPENDAWVDGKRCVLQFSEHRFSTLSIMHSYLDWGRKETSEIGKWKKIAMTEDWLKKNGVLYDANWFKDKNGKAVSRNLFEFVRDHLGYRIVGQSLKITGDSKPSAPIQVAMSLQNRGFAAAFNLESGFAILDSQNKVVSTVKCGNPAAWYNRNPDNYSDTKQLTHTLSAKMKLPGRAGRYKLAFYLKNSLNRYARVSIDAAVVNGYHILHEFDVA